MISLEKAYELGRTIGFFVPAAVFAVALIAIILVNYFAARRHGTNSKCVWAVAWLCIGGLIFVIGAFVTRAAKTEPPLNSLPGLLAIIVLSIAVALAINGLGEFKRFPGHFKHGRKRARAVLAIPVLAALGVVAAVIVHSTGHPIFGSQISGTAGETITNKSWNFQLIAPPPWSSIDATKLNPTARTGLARQGPQMVSMVLADDLSKAGPPTLDSVVDALKTKLKEAPRGEILADEPQDENGLHGRRLESLGVADGNLTYYVHWLTNYDETFYQVITWGSPLARDQVRAESRKLAGGFRILDAKIAPIAEADRIEPKFASEKFGYAIDLSKTIWNRRWPTLEKDVPTAQFGVLNAHGTAAFCVIPMWIGDDDVSLDALTSALTVRVGVPFPDGAIFANHSHHQGPLRGRSFAFERAQDGTKLLYRLRVLRGRGFAYLLAAWMNKRSEAASEFLDLAMNCVTFPEMAEGKPALTDDRIRATHAGTWNDIGVALVRANDLAAAVLWFQRAYELDRSQLAALVNYADTLIKLGRAADAQTVIDGFIVGDDRPILRRLRAQILQANGKRDEAIRILIELQKSAPGDHETAVLLTDAFLNALRFAEALAECDRLIAAGADTAGVLQRKGLAEAQLKRYREAKATLEKALAKEPANADIKRLLEQVVALSAPKAK